MSSCASALLFVCRVESFSTMSSATDETVVPINGQTVGETSDQPAKVGVKRKRTPSLDEREGEEPSGKKKELINGTSETSEGVEEDEREKVAILDAGAQYGKVSVHSFLVGGASTCVCWIR